MDATSLVLRSNVKFILIIAQILYNLAIGISFVRVGLVEFYSFVLTTGTLIRMLHFNELFMDMYPIHGSRFVLTYCIHHLCVCVCVGLRVCVGDR